MAQSSGKENDLFVVQVCPLTVTPLGRGKSVTVSKCHSNQRFLAKGDRTLRPKTVTVSGVNVSGQTCRLIPIRLYLSQHFVPSTSHAENMLHSLQTLTPTKPERMRPKPDKDSFEKN